MLVGKGKSDLFSVWKEALCRIIRNCPQVTKEEGSLRALLDSPLTIDTQKCELAPNPLLDPETSVEVMLFNRRFKGHSPG